VLITGCHGRLGSLLVEKVSGKFRVTGIGQDKSSLVPSVDYIYVCFDLLSKKQKYKEMFQEIRPDYVINAAGMTDVDQCETNRELCWRLNVEVVENLLYACSKTETKIIQISTDYVFDGKNGPYREEDRTNPINYYGKSKLAAENAILAGNVDYAVVRTSTLYGAPSIKEKGNILTYIVQQLQNGNQIKLAVDEIRNPTLYDNLAESIWKLIRLERSGVFNIAGKSMVNRYEFAQEIARCFQLDNSLIIPLLNSSDSNRALRPKSCGLIVEKAMQELCIDLYEPAKGLDIIHSKLTK